MGCIFEDDYYTKVQKRLEKSVFKKLEKEGDVDPKNCVTKMIIRQAALKHPPSSAVNLKPQRTKLNAMVFTHSIIPSREVKRQRLEWRKQAEEDLIGKIVMKSRLCPMAMIPIHQHMNLAKITFLTIIMLTTTVIYLPLQVARQKNQCYHFVRLIGVYAGEIWKRISPNQQLRKKRGIGIKT